jgi:3-methylcrotonyl-CoA carboxylase alpha subunit
VREGDSVTPYYDPMIAKVIAHGATRDDALDALSHALGGTIVAGPRTNVAFLRALCDAGEFRAGGFDTGFIDRNLDALGAAEQAVDPEAVRMGALRLADAALGAAAAAGGSPWRRRTGFSSSGHVGRPFNSSSKANGRRSSWPGGTSPGPSRASILRRGSPAARTAGSELYATEGQRVSPSLPMAFTS